jgi:hypothetical protein
MLTPRGALRDLDIGPDPRLTQVDLTDTPTGAVVAGSIVALDGSVSPQHGRDVMQSLLLAQLAANAKANRFRESLNWYKTYQSTLESIGWVVSGSTSFKQFNSPVSQFTIGSVINDCFRFNVTSEELNLVNRTFRAFVRDPTSPAQFVWECPSHSGGLGNFQFGISAETDVVMLQIGRFVLDTPQRVVRFALEEFGHNARFTTSFASMTLNEGFFAQLRTEIEKKLDGRFDASVAPIELPPS